MTRCAPLRTRVRQVGVKVETTCGVEQALVAADFSIRASEISAEINSQLIENNALSPYLSPKAAQAGEQTGSAKVTAFLVGSGVPANKPEIDQLLAISSMSSTAVMKVAIGAVSAGPFRRGEVINQATSLAVGRVVLPCKTGDAFLYLTVTSGTFNGTNIITGATSSATTTPSASPVAAGWRYAPDTSNRSTGTVRVEEDGYKKTVIGACADWSISADSSNMAMIDFTISGNKGTCGDAAMTSGITLKTTAYPLFRDSLFAMDRETSTYVPIVNKVGATLGNSVSVRKDANSATGLIAAQSTARAPKITFTPEAVLAADFDFITKMSNASTISCGFRFKASDNEVWVFADNCQIESATEGDQDGTMTNDISLRCFAPNGDGEIELIFI